MKYFLVAGEASGDLHGANLMQALKQNDAEAEFCFFGGDLMQAQGGTLLKHYREMAFMGFIPVLLNLRTILRNMEVCQKEIVAYQPDAVILIDYPGFNLDIAKFVKKKTGIPVYYYISPKVWAWKEYRVKAFKKYVDKMLCILPFEVDFFKKHNYEVNYVGNPTVDEVAEFKEENSGDTFKQFTADNNLQDKPIIALLAGSRKQEIKDNLPSMLQVIANYPSYQPVIAGAPGIDLDYYSQYIGDSGCKLIFGQTYRLLSHAKAALVTSGTATLETALFRVPQAVCYKTPVPHIVYFAFKHILTTPYISLVNLIADRVVVQELFAKFFSVGNIQKELDKILHDEDYRAAMLSEYDRIINILGTPGASNHAAKLIVSGLN
ncbi:lipid-A-disaccharide synthase [Dysgonomonas sp. PH5-45]|uniref:lipid-A-disaccharide synthase n=1 Tax=unclassified Dysgonomonas TaxID=2630389 RepID=UPI002475E1C7|nr:MULTISPECIES: lipid-A-disaccharide synthase [unclassified Dysgonomonas]MDH6355803.1 lipid-A-disaccharide synthase [Dysgonomonas sp. PH5-45]MDH6388700.1 lipid-A-disaccharide synthase [Dysgonomonas sp. PH5-37]